VATKRKKRKAAAKAPAKPKQDAQAIAEQPDFDPQADPLAKFNPDDFRPADEALSVSHPNDVYRVLSLYDELQILEEIQGRATEAMIYQFTNEDGGKTTGLSYRGVAEAVRTLNSRGFTRIRISPKVAPSFEETVDDKGNDAWQCTVYAEDEQHGGGNYGVFIQPKRVKLDSGEILPDPFARAKALGKAQRNAYEPLLPLELVEALKAQYIGQGRVKRIPQANQAEADVPKALTDDRAKQQIKLAEGLYEEIKKVNRSAMVPGQFNRLIVQSHHDHDALDRTVGILEDFLHTEEEIAEMCDALRAVVGPEKFGSIMESIDRLRSQMERHKATSEALADQESAAV
jgi:hypothetical protein